MVRVACQVLAAFRPGGARLQLALLLGVGVVRRLQLVALGDQLVLREVQRVGLREQREQPALVHQVVDDQHLVVVAGCLELAALQRVSDRDVQRHLRRGARAPPTLTRPRTRVPSMVKNRRSGFSIGDE